MHHAEIPHERPETAIDPDVDLAVPAQRRELAAHPTVLLAIAVGGALGSAARYGLSLALPHDAGRGVPWATLVTNAVGCLAIGVLMVVITEWLTPHVLLRPFLGVGVLGGFTTFSTYAVELRTMFARGALGPALLYLVLTLAAALAGVTAGSALARQWRPAAARRSAT